MNPPPIGDALGFAWERVKQDPWTMIIGVIVAQVLFMIPIAGIGLGMAGLMTMAAKVARGQSAEIGDVLSGFQKPVDNIMIGLLQASGMLLCGFGVLITAPLFFAGYFLVAERGLNWQQAMDVCLTQVKPAIASWAIFWFVLTLFSQLGLIACCVGVLGTSAVTMVALAHAYDQTLGQQLPV
jgi:hypothetical protein